MVLLAKGACLPRRVGLLVFPTRSGGMHVVSFQASLCIMLWSTFCLTEERHLGAGLRSL